MNTATHFQTPRVRVDKIVSRSARTLERTVEAVHFGSTTAKLSAVNGLFLGFITSRGNVWQALESAVLAFAAVEVSDKLGTAALKPDTKIPHWLVTTVDVLTDAGDIGLPGRAPLAGVFGALFGFFRGIFSKDSPDILRSVRNYFSPPKPGETMPEKPVHGVARRALEGAVKGGIGRLMAVWASEKMQVASERNTDYKPQQLEIDSYDLENGEDFRKFIRVERTPTGGVVEKENFKQRNALGGKERRALDAATSQAEEGLKLVCTEAGFSTWRPTHQIFLMPKKSAFAPFDDEETSKHDGKEAIVKHTVDLNGTNEHAVSFIRARRDKIKALTQPALTELIARAMVRASLSGNELTTDFYHPKNDPNVLKRMIVHNNGYRGATLRPWEEDPVDPRMTVFDAAVNDVIVHAAMVKMNLKPGLMDRGPGRDHAYRLQKYINGLAQTSPEAGQRFMHALIDGKRKMSFEPLYEFFKPNASLAEKKIILDGILGVHFKDMNKRLLVYAAERPVPR